MIRKVKPINRLAKQVMGMNGTLNTFQLISIDQAHTHTETHATQAKRNTQTYTTYFIQTVKKRV